MLFGALGVLILLAGIAGRFIGTPNVGIFGHVFVAGSFISLANTCLLLGIFLHLVSPGEK
jgi:hypothetical protein